VPRGAGDPAAAYRRGLAGADADAGVVAVAHVAVDDRRLCRRRRLAEQLAAGDDDASAPQAADEAVAQLHVRTLGDDDAVAGRADDGAAGDLRPAAEDEEQ
jgi:hypothetical protein